MPGCEGQGCGLQAPGGLSREPRRDAGTATGSGGRPSLAQSGLGRFCAGLCVAGCVAAPPPPPVAASHDVPRQGCMSPTGTMASR